MTREPGVRVSDHAIVRYLERVQGLDLSDLRREIEEIAAPAARCGATCVVRDGFRYVLTDGVVVTVAPKKSDPIGQ